VKRVTRSSSEPRPPHHPILVGALLPPDVPEGHMLRSWLDSWSGVGHVLDAMTAASHHVELRQSVFGWRAEFHREAMQHSRST
jgi:hypothetical protein